MPSTQAFKSSLLPCLLSVLAFAAACSEGKVPFADSTSAATACVVDEDGDGYGLGCARGSDCDDGDPKIDTQCLACAKPEEGCDCEPGTSAVECFTQALTDHDTLLCTNGTRFCRDAKWTACEGANVFEVEAPELRLGASQRAIIGDAGTASCSPCRPGCFPVRDPLDPAAGPLDGTSTSADYAPGGGVTIRAATGGVPQAIDTGMQCAQPGAPADEDCDGIPDVVDDVEGSNATSYGTIRATVFMDLVPGESESAKVRLPFRLTAADVYFLFDASESLTGVPAQLSSAITTGSFLDADVECADTDLDDMANDELKTQGIAGNLDCVIPRAELGAGFVREIPFLGPDATGVAYGDADEHLFEQRVDIGATAATLSSALANLTIDPNHGGGDAQMQGLLITATGEESYVGWDRPAVPGRIGCGASTFGYPCFRDGALPIVVLVAAEPMHNGPTTPGGDLGASVPNAYPGSILSEQVQAGTYPHYLPVPNSNESYGSAFATTAEDVGGEPLGGIGDDFVTFTGDTTNMAVDLSAAELGCPGLSASGAEAVLAFRVNQRANLTVSTTGTRFDNVLGIVRADAPIASANPTDRSFDFPIAGSGDDVPNDLGSLPAGVSALVTGVRTGALADYPRELLGCYEHASFTPPTDSSDYSPDVAFKFNLDADMDLSFQVPADASIKSLSLFEGRPNLGDMDVIVPANAEQITLAPDVSENALRLISGYTGADATRSGQNLSTAGLNADVPLQAFVDRGCDPGGAAEDAPDTRIAFSLSQPTRVRIETSGDGPGMGADFEHLLGLFRDSAAVDPTDRQVPGTLNETLASAYVIDEDDFVAGGWAHVTGSVWNDATSTLMNADYDQAEVGGAAGCGPRGGGDSGSPDAVFSFTLSDTRTLQFDTENSEYRTFLSLHEAREITSDNLNETQAEAHNLGTLDGKRLIVRGNTQARNQDFSPEVFDAAPVNGLRPAPKSLGCGANSPDVVFQFTLTQTTSVQIDTLGSTYDTVLGVYDNRGPDHFVLQGDTYEYPAELICNDDFPSTVGAVSSRVSLDNLPAGTYYVVVAGWSTASGTYQLNIADVAAPAFSALPLIACDSGSLPQDDELSQLTRTLGPGTYALVLKGDATQVSPDYDYELNIREVLGNDDLVACGYRNGGDPTIERGVIEEFLPAGDYSVAVRGAHAGDAGSYRVLIRDVEFSPLEIGCHDSKIGDAPSFTRSLVANKPDGTPIDYWLVLRDFDTNDPASTDPYSIYIRDPHLGIPLDACAQAASGSYTGSFEPGDYYAVVKGRSATDKGWYQVSMGDSDLVASADYTDLATYPDARDALTSRGVRVMGAAIGDEANLREQLSALASDTQAVGETSGALVVTASPADPELGNTLGSKIVASIRDLSAGLRMSVGIRLNPAPDNPPTPFTFAAQAIDQTADGCNAPVNQVHQNCGAGATPEFSVTFTNPGAPNAVPLNPDDPHGGYYMTLEVVGDGRYVLESIPVYIVPADVAPERPQRNYEAFGRYWQDVGSPNCLSNERPEWSRLSWDATLPSGTSIVWQVCAAETRAELATCVPTTLATVTGGGACTADSDCPDGFCASNVCQFAIGPDCEDDNACGQNGVCRDGSCRFTSLPIDPAPALTREGDQSYLRVAVEMFASGDQQRAPIVYDWQVDYDCRAAE